MQNTSVWSMYRSAFMKLTALSDWFPAKKGFRLILGPCSAETREQILSTAHGLKQSNCDVGFFRAGIWKPRTRPDSFQGHGKPALKWLQEVRAKYGFRLTVEVATAKHVEECLAHGIDGIWVGARTVVNPFSVQEIASAVQGIDIPIFVKNPIVPDIGLWLGALERFYQNGTKKLVAIHRGFNTIRKNFYRFSPEWSIPIELKRTLPMVPIFCDPSHMAGKRELLPSLIQKALDFGVDGLMIESHSNPNAAWSDSEQQLLPNEMAKLLSSVEIKRENTSDQNFSRNIKFLRKEIDQLDKVLLETLATRMDIVDQIREQKAENKITALQISRWKEILQSRMEQGEQLGLSNNFVKELLQLIHEEAIQRQTDNLAYRKNKKNQLEVHLNK